MTINLEPLNSGKNITERKKKQFIFVRQLKARDPNELHDLLYMIGLVQFC